MERSFARTSRTRRAAGVLVVATAVASLLASSAPSNAAPRTAQATAAAVFGPPDAVADEVWGQGGNFETTRGPTEASGLREPKGTAVDGAGNLYIADTGNNRVLYFPAGTTTAATRVYGRPNPPGTTFPFGLRPRADTMSNPQGVALDGAGGLYVADTGNNRVLYFPAGTITAATRVYGQLGSLTTAIPNITGGIDANGLVRPTSVAVDGAGGLYVADTGNNRVLYFPAGTTTATRVYGQDGDFTTNAPNKTGTNASGLFNPVGLALDPGGRLYVVDEFNNRVLSYAAGATTATVVFGQHGDFTTNAVNSPALDADALFEPAAVSVDTAGNVAIADRRNNRVLWYPSGSTTATRVYGQHGNFTISGANDVGVRADTLWEPAGVLLSGTVFIADTANHRVLSYPNVSTTGTAVYGQAGDLTASVPNRVDFGASYLSQPTGLVADDLGGFYVADTEDHRVLHFPSGSSAATTVYGQNGNFRTALSANGADGLVQPTGVTVDRSGGVFIASTGEHVVHFYPLGSTAAARTYALPHGPSSRALSRPNGLAVDAAGNLYVADKGNHRVLFFPAGSTTATRVYGQHGSFDTGTPNKGGVSADSLDSPVSLALDDAGNLYVGDVGNHRVLFFPAGSTTATRVYGQRGSMTTNAENNGGVSAESLSWPSGLTIDRAGRLYVADEFNHRVLGFPSGSTRAATVYGQLGSFTTNELYKGGLNAASLSHPIGLDIDHDGQLYVVDEGSNRVLRFDAGPALGAAFTPVVPERLLDTRPEAQIGYSGPKPSAAATITLDVTGTGTTNVPDDATAVVLNITGTEPDTNGYVTVWPCGQPRPTASNLNLTTNTTTPNLTITAIGTNGDICIYTQNPTHLIADINGWYPAD